MKTTQSDRTPARVYSIHAEAIFNLLKQIETDGMIDCTKADWGHVGSIRAAREKLVEVAFVLGALTSKEAKDDHGVTL